MKQASAVIASLAERLANDIEAFAVPNGTGQATLHMFAAMIRSLNTPEVPEAASLRDAIGPRTVGKQVLLAEDE